MWPVACHMPEGGLASRILVEAFLMRDVVPTVDERRREDSGSPSCGGDAGEEGDDNGDEGNAV